jgi:hypothetical protein
MSTVWMRMPGQTWPGAAAWFLGRASSGAGMMHLHRRESLRQCPSEGFQFSAKFDVTAENRGLA